MQIIFHCVIQILQTDYKKNEKLQKTRFDPVMSEFITDFFALIVERCNTITPELIKPYRREIFELFSAD